MPKIQIESKLLTLLKERKINGSEFLVLAYRDYKGAWISAENVESTLNIKKAYFYQIINKCKYIWKTEL